tara:strand:+ start:1833 stop:2063 length:231 start_codon:yes stop_codon:yes gene_type:complete
MSLARANTNQLLEAIEEGLLDKDQVIMACVKYMSESDVADMCRINEFFPEYEEDEDEDDGQPDWHQEWEDFGECYE